MGNLDYHKYLQSVADADLAYVRKKDAQYNASWKKRGGVGAFFTIARPWDRLETMVRSNEYELFDIIMDEDFDGPDGSAIACVRDMRRYLLLVEAEMIDRMVKAGREVPADAIERVIKEDVLALMATGVDPVIARVVDDEGTATGKYSSPYRIGHEEMATEFSRHSRAREAYTALLPDVYRLDMFVSPEVFNALNSDTKIRFTRLPTAPCDCWLGFVLTAEMIPKDVRGTYPTYNNELNEFEWNSVSVEQRAMYYFDSSDNKRKIHSAFAGWCR